MGGKTVAKGVATGSLDLSCFGNSLSNGALQNSFVNMMTPLLFGRSVLPAIILRRQNFAIN